MANGDDMTDPTDRFYRAHVPGELTAEDGYPAQPRYQQAEASDRMAESLSPIGIANVRRRSFMVGNMYGC